MRIHNYIENDPKAQSLRWLSDAEAFTRPKPALRIRDGSCALLVVDMNRYFTHPSGPRYLPASAYAQKNIQSLLARWRSAGWRVAFARHGHLNDTDAGMFNKFFSGYILTGSPDAEIIDEITPTPVEPVFDKNSYDAFLGTSLQQWLTDVHCDQLLICGVLTHMCVETTARAAFCRGFEVYIPVDAVAADNELNHINGLQSMAQTVAVLYTTEQILQRKAPPR
ncbi:MAG: cysteine hydrolase [Deltaproteobacteria bacterium]|nr:cysteine hydrolase [Deltaproteobacteria bacterium]MBN2673010.1 cysteine hydrolase [Deltaproteobacteria bacterium]